MELFHNNSAKKEEELEMMMSEEPKMGETSLMELNWDLDEVIAELEELLE